MRHHLLLILIGFSFFIVPSAFAEDAGAGSRDAARLCEAAQKKLDNFHPERSMSASFVQDPLEWPINTATDYGRKPFESKDISDTLKAIVGAPDSTMNNLLERGFKNAGVKAVCAPITQLIAKRKGFVAINFGLPLETVKKLRKLAKDKNTTTDKLLEQLINDAASP